MNYFSNIRIAFLSILLSCHNQYGQSAAPSGQLHRQITTAQFPKYICDNTINNLNISVLLDLSDRIEAPDQKENDIRNLMSIAQIFKDHIMKKRFNQLKDRINVFFEPNPSLNKTHEVIEKLKFDITKNSSKKVMESIEKNYAEYPPLLYEWAQKNPETKKGAAIWRFFKNKAADNCIKECHRNILIIFTDGYLYHKGDFLKVENRTSYINQKIINTSALYQYDWKTYAKEKDMGILWKQEDTLKNLEVLVLGIHKNNNQNPNAEEIITHYWSQWFQEMGIDHYTIKSTDATVYLKEAINDFILYRK
ncbi:hypothetical protein [Aquimarina sp. RZ0]|uniref:hypothetical protein n=1 Tax=Aquimarina sp. RZ0 TaxID=2607730 RepID=UPI0011F3DC63|nr:hypothetical protein [Aquimarina sp. RZ0]KAA1245871.1 hypothetical protein F0000_09945 [Aquimarina sp. RZ0]